MDLPNEDKPESYNYIITLGEKEQKQLKSAQNCIRKSNN